MGWASCSHTPHPEVQARSAYLRCKTRGVVNDIGGGGWGVGRGQVPGTPAQTAGQCQSLLHRRGTLSPCHEATGSLACPSASLEALG